MKTNLIVTTLVGATLLTFSLAPGQQSIPQSSTAEKGSTTQSKMSVARIKKASVTPKRKSQTDLKKRSTRKRTALRTRTVKKEAAKTTVSNSTATKKQAVTRASQAKTGPAATSTHTSRHVRHTLKKSHAKKQQSKKS